MQLVLKPQSCLGRTYVPFDVTRVITIPESEAESVISSNGSSSLMPWLKGEEKHFLLLSDGAYREELDGMPSNDLESSCIDLEATEMWLPAALPDVPPVIMCAIVHKVRVY